MHVHPDILNQSSSSEPYDSEKNSSKKTSTFLEAKKTSPFHYIMDTFGFRATPGKTGWTGSEG